MIKPRLKVVICCVLAVVCGTLVVLDNLPARFKIDQLRFNETSITSFVTTSDNKVLLVNPDFKNLTEVKNFLDTKRVKTIDGIICTTTKNFEPSRINKFLTTYKVKTLYLPLSHPAISNLRAMGYNVVVVDESLTRVADNIDLKLCLIDDYNIGMQLVFDNTNIVYLNNNIKSSYFDRLQTVFDTKVDYLYIINSDENIYQDYIQPIHYVDSLSNIKVSF